MVSRTSLKGVLAEMLPVYIKYRKDYQEANGRAYSPSVEKADSDLVDFVLCGVSGYKSFGDYERIDDYSNEIGEAAFVIFKWKDKTYKMPYSYKSHYGADYYGDGSDIVEVTPKVVETTIWETVKQNK